MSAEKPVPLRKSLLMMLVEGIVVIPIVAGCNMTTIPVTRVARPTPVGGYTEEYCAQPAHVDECNDYAKTRNLFGEPAPSPTVTPQYIKTIIDPTMVAQTTIIPESTAFIPQPTATSIIERSTTPAKPTIIATATVQPTVFDARPAIIPQPTFTPVPSPTIAPTFTHIPNTPTSLPERSATVSASPESIKDVPEHQRLEIQDAVVKATKWYESHGINPGSISVFAFTDAQTTVEYYLQRNPQLPESERARIRNNAPHFTAFVGSKDDLYIVTTSPGWTRASPIIHGPVLEGRYHTVAHEIFHIWQTKIGAYKYRPVPWMNEGIPHYLAALFLQETNMYSYEAVRSGHINVASRIKQPIHNLESDSEFYRGGSADNYSVGFLAVEYLVRNFPNSGINALADYWKKISEGQSHPVAFKATFGKTPTEFYNEFEAYRSKGFTNIS